MIAMVSQDAIFTAIITCTLVLLSGIGAVVYRSFSNSSDLDDIKKILDNVNLQEIKTRVDELWIDRRETWDFLKRRGDIEVVDKGLGHKNSPLSIERQPNKDMIIKAYIPLLPQLEEISIEAGCVGGNIDKECESRMWPIVAKKMNKIMAETICPFLGVHEGGCVSLAIATLRYKHAHP